MLTQARLHEVLDYDPESGVFRWKVKPARRYHVGSVAGDRATGYVRIKVDGESWGAHRLAWLYVYGETPTAHIDHLNGDTLDNRIANLRVASVRQNAQNRWYHRAGKLPGTNYLPKRGGTKKWASRIWIDGKLKVLGYFSTEIEAHVAYMAACREASCNPSL
jgi:hypothetical protein